MFHTQIFKPRFLLVWMLMFLFILAVQIPSVPAKETAPLTSFKIVRERGVLRVGVSPFTPWVFKGKKGKLVGFEIDVARKLAKDMGVTAKFISYDWENLIPALQKGHIDIISAGMAITPQRALKVNFSSPYATSGISLATNIERTKHIKSVEELNHKAIKIGVVSETISEDLAKRIFNKASIIVYKKSNAAEKAIVSGTIHAYLEAKPIPRFIALDHPKKVDVPLSEPLLGTRAGFAINKGDPDFLNFLNSWIVAREADTWLPSTHDYWFKTLKWK